MFFLVKFFFNPINFAAGKPLSFGVVVITLPEEQTLIELHPRIVDVALAGGFPYNSGLDRVRTLEEILSNRWLKGSYDWVSQPNNKTPFQPSIGIRAKLNYQEEQDPKKLKGSSLEFWFQNGTTETFTLDEWQLFAKFYNEILPTAFPNATLSIAPSDHPARFTDKHILEEVVKNIDIEIPEKYQPTHSQ
jgi:hypothetical protein